MTTLSPIPEPSPEEIRRGLAAAECYAQPVGAEPAAGGAAPGVESRRVRKLRQQVAEARQLDALTDEALATDTHRVRRRRRAAVEAARLHELAQLPTVRAWQAARVRRLVVTAAMVSLVLALGWSTVGVQRFAAEGADPWTAPWIVAWCVEPLISLALLAVVASKAYLATRGHPIRSHKLTAIEGLFLVLTLGMNTGPYLPWVADPFSFPKLVLHALGPVVAVAIVAALPTVLDAFATLDHGGGVPGGTNGEYRENAGGRYTPSTPTPRADIEALTARARALIASGDLPQSPGVHKIREALGVGTTVARRVQNALNDGQ